MPQPTTTTLPINVGIISIDGAVVVFMGVVCQCIADSLWRYYLLNIEQLKGVETDLVERFDVPMTNKATPDVMNSITNNNFIVI